jgi:phospholipid/cholesterol/gamma-HCH transport system substrate-binding protein
MRRLALIALALLAAVAWMVTGAAGADDSHTYKVEMYDAFGIVNGSDVRVAGVNAGTVTGLDVDAKKRALLTVSLTGPLSTLGKDTTCRSEPQSLIAEYFIDCSPKGPPLRDGGTIPASHVRQTVQFDLVANSLRQSYRDRLAELINEFGTGLAGNAHALNQAIRLGSPALFNLRKVLDILAQQNATIRDLNVNSDRIISQLASNRANVIRFIQTAGRTAAVSASRRADLAVDFNRLDNFLHALGPTITELGATARQSTPLLRDLHGAAPGLNTLATDLPAFNRSAQASLAALGQASVPGRKAVTQGLDEVQALKRAGVNAQPVADVLAKFLDDLAAPSRATNIDARAADTCAPGTADPKTKPCYSTGRKAPTGFSGMESLLNYAYYQTGALNQFDQIGHLLHVSIYDISTGPCGNFSSGHDPKTGAVGVGSKTGGKTTDITKTAPCVSWLGKNQPGINQNLHLPPYDPSVCPQGTIPAAALQYCNPAGKATATANSAATSKVATSASTTPSASRNPAAGPAGSTGAATAPSGAAAGGRQGPVPNLPPGVLPQGQNALHRLEQILGLPAGSGLGSVGGNGGALGGSGGVLGGGALGGQPKAGKRAGSPAGASPQAAAVATQNLLDFLLGNGT